MTTLRRLLLRYAWRIIARYARGDDVAEWALAHPGLAYAWLTSGYVLESAFPAVVDRALQQHEDAERVAREADRSLN